MVFVSSHLVACAPLAQAAKRLGVSRKKMVEAMRERESYNVGERWVVELAARKHGGGNPHKSAASSPSSSKKPRKRKNSDLDQPESESADIFYFFSLCVCCTLF